MTTSGEGQDLKPHGLIFRTDEKKNLTVSCQCRASETKHSRTKGGGEYYEPMEQDAGQNVFVTYNVPENHWIDFAESDRIKM